MWEQIIRHACFSKADGLSKVGTIQNQHLPQNDLNSLYARQDLFP